MWRTGFPNVKFFEAMEKEHKSNKKEFTAPNYGIVTCPAKEWEVVIQCDKSEEKVYGGHQRRIQDYRVLCETARSKTAKLIEEEVVAIILYTGPMARYAPFFYLVECCHN
jgi:hypothetical protein